MKNCTVQRSVPEGAWATGAVIAMVCDSPPRASDWATGAVMEMDIRSELPPKI